MTSTPPSVVVHVPHASTVIPDDIPFVLTPDALTRELLRMTDHFTDDLFALPAEFATRVVFPVNRLVVDPERFTDDAQEVMAKKGMGVIYERTADGLPLRVRPTAAERRDLLARFYEPHHAALTVAVEAALTAHGHVLVIDGHSFPAVPLPYENDRDPKRPDICVGTDAFHTPGWLRDAAVTAFEEKGWTVAVDRPFAGAIVPMRYYSNEPRVRAVMIEVNRGLYMDESSGARLPGFEEVARRVREAVARVIARVSMWKEDAAPSSAKTSTSLA